MRDDVMNQMKQAMKSGEKLRLETLRYIWSEIRNAEIDKKSELSDDEVHAMLKREMKRRGEAVEQLKENGREEAFLEEEAKMAVVSEFMMEEMNENEVMGLIDEVFDEGITDFGQLMGKVMGKTKGKADGQIVQKLVREKLGNSS